jgi:dienelactone hydrolase
MTLTSHDPARSRVLELLAVPSPDSIRPTAVRREHFRDDALGRWDRIELDTDDGDTIPCILITPDEHVGVDAIAVHQHAGAFTLGKSESAGLTGDPSLAYGGALAGAGARVILPDLVGFEERQRHWTNDPAADERLDALFRASNGTSLQAKHTRDIAAVTSWMQETSAVPNQLGIIGHSLGGGSSSFGSLGAQLTVLARGGCSWHGSARAPGAVASACVVPAARPSHPAK